MWKNLGLWQAQRGWVGKEQYVFTSSTGQAGPEISELWVLGDGLNWRREHGQQGKRKGTNLLLATSRYSCVGSAESRGALVCSVCWFLWCKHSCTANFKLQWLNQWLARFLKVSISCQRLIWTGSSASLIVGQKATWSIFYVLSQLTVKILGSSHSESTLQMGRLRLRE